MHTTTAWYKTGIWPLSFFKIFMLLWFKLHFVQCAITLLDKIIAHRFCDFMVTPPPPPPPQQPPFKYITFKMHKINHSTINAFCQAASRTCVCVLLQYIECSRKSIKYRCRLLTQMVRSTTLFNLYHYPLYKLMIYIKI